VWHLEALKNDGPLDPVLRRGTWCSSRRRSSETCRGLRRFDPRSWAHNTEMGLVIECPELAQQLASAIDRDLLPSNAWRIVLDAQGQVTWVSGDEVRREPPAREEGQRLEESLHLLLPADLY